MRESISINGRDLTAVVPASGDHAYNPTPTSGRGKVAQFDLDDDYDIDRSFDVVTSNETGGDNHDDD